MSFKKVVVCMNEKKCGWESTPKPQYQLERILKCPRCNGPVEVREIHKQHSNGFRKQPLKANGAETKIQRVRRNSGTQSVRLL